MEHFFRSVDMPDQNAGSVEDNDAKSAIICDEEKLASYA
jgi:hypothetical protein